LVLGLALVLGLGLDLALVIGFGFCAAFELRRPACFACFACFARFAILPVFLCCPSQCWRTGQKGNLERRPVALFC
jgi:hypothetical protein